MTIRTAITAIMTAGAIASSALLPGAAAAQQTTSDETPRAVADARAATARYQRPETAIAAGYLPTDECVELPGTGGMGYHYLNPALLADGTDHSAPEVLIYADQPSGKRKLVAVEYIVLDVDQDPSTTEYHTWADEHYHPVTGDGSEFSPYHYPLHVWLWSSNPTGLFEDWNPRISC